MKTARQSRDAFAWCVSVLILLCMDFMLHTSVHFIQHYDGKTFDDDWLGATEKQDVLSQQIKTKQPERKHLAKMNIHFYHMIKSKRISGTKKHCDTHFLCGSTMTANLTEVNNMAVCVQAANGYSKVNMGHLPCDEQLRARRFSNPPMTSAVTDPFYYLGVLANLHNLPKDKTTALFFSPQLK